MTIDKNQERGSTMDHVILMIHMIHFNSSPSQVHSVHFRKTKLNCWPKTVQYDRFVALIIAKNGDNVVPVVNKMSCKK